MIGIWVGCGFDTIQLIYPPLTILGYDACVPLNFSNPIEGPHVVVAVS